MELTKDDYDILIELLEREMDTLRLPAWYHEYYEFKRLRDTLIFIRDESELGGYFMEIKVNDKCPRCKYCLGMTPQGMYSCGYANDGSELNIGVDVVLNCANFELEEEKEPCDKISLLEHELEMDRLRKKIHQLEKEKVAHMKGIERLKGSNNDLKGAYNHLLETFKKEQEADSKIVEENVKLENEKSELIKASKRKDELIQDYREKLKGKDNEINLLNSKLDKLGEYYRTDEKLIDNIQKVIFPQEEGFDCTYSYDEILNKVKELKNLTEKKETLEQRYDNIHYALYKDTPLDELISSEVEMIEDLKKRAADSDYYKEKSELLEERNNNQFDIIREKNKKLSELEEKLKKANKLADSWKRDYEFVRDKFVHPVYDILYPDNLNRDINVADFLSNIKDLKIYADENESMYKELQEWREKCIARGKDIDHLISENKEKDKKISEKDYEIKRLKKDISDLTLDRTTVKNIMLKNKNLWRTTLDQEVTIKALLITIKEMCKEDETNE